ncbi:MAG TPA: c-type cytochrome, partial [Kofleriaceae bacterium]|nr:c-type cytochrome [Kofleriaceae bacterium]
RRGGSLLTLADAASGQIAVRRFACAEPRGLAWDPAADTVHVACTGGELVTFRAAGGDAIRTLHLDRDLRDVIVSGGQLLVTRFRSSEILTVDAQGAIVSRATPPPVLRFGGPVPLGSPSMAPEAVAEVAWRTIQLPDGRLVMSHQRQLPRMLNSKDQGGYGGSCDSSPVESAVSVMQPGQAPVAVDAIARGALPVDIAASRTGDKLAVVLAGQKTVTVVDTARATTLPDMERCRGMDGDDDDDDDDQGDDLGTPTSTAFANNGDLVVFYPEKPALVVRVAAGSSKRLIALPGDRSLDRGRAIFHTQTLIGLACASCHPEGREDGRVWSFAELGSRRTQSLAGNLLERAPFHWGGDMASLDVLMDDVFSQRMVGGPVDAHAKVALGAWLDRIPAPAPGSIADTAAVARGQAVFEAAACGTCHNGDLLTNNQLVNVGTGAKFKVPSLLGIGARAPYMHTGCAKTLTERFGPCGGGDTHGLTSNLTQAQIADLVAFLESL